LHEVAFKKKYITWKNFAFVNVAVITQHIIGFVKQYPWDYKNLAVISFRHRPYGRMWPSIKIDAAVHMIM